MKVKKNVVTFGHFIKQLTVTFILQYDIQGKYKDIRIILPHDICICRRTEGTDTRRCYQPEMAWY